MKRKLTPREWMLLGVLAVLVVVAGYITLFYMPTTDARNAALAEAESYRQQMEAAMVRLTEKQRMERALEEIFARDPDPMPLPDYDNLHPIMVELNSILSTAASYSLSFASVDSSKSVVRREINISFTCGSYDSAKDVLRQLHDCTFRCLLNNLTISRGRSGGSATVTGSIVFFEMQAGK